MKKWGIDTKKNLITKLTASIEEKLSDKHDFSSCFGAWEDDRSAEDIIKDLRADRINSNDIEEF